MKLLIQRKTEINPLVTKQAGNTIQGESYIETIKEGKFYRVFPMNIKDINFLQSLCKYIEVFPPAIGQGDGILVKASLVDGNEHKATPELKLKCLSEAKAKELGYTSITTKISVDSEQSIIISMQESMKGRDAVWIVTGALNQKDDNSGLFVQLAIFNQTNERE
jgi:hypothetical protein